MRLWIDTDVGTNPDDAVALLCAAAHSDVDLVGVSTVDGDTEWRAEIGRTLVDAPVVPGARQREDVVVGLHRTSARATRVVGWRAPARRQCTSAAHLRSFEPGARRFVRPQGLEP